jgi:hypothetical protein
MLNIKKISISCGLLLASMTTTGNLFANEITLPEGRWGTDRSGFVLDIGSNNKVSITFSEERRTAASQRGFSVVNLLGVSPDEKGPAVFATCPNDNKHTSNNFRVCIRSGLW